MSNLKEQNFNTDYITLPVGEAAKSMKEFSNVISQLTDLECDRSTTVLALGGGVVGDIAGFAASTFMRGIEYFQIPTTLLAMVDSSIGGKTGINIAEGKNMVGTFYQPKGVLIDPDILNSLPKGEVISGLGEVIKYGAIRDADFLQEISAWLDDIVSFPFYQEIQQPQRLNNLNSRNNEFDIGQFAFINPSPRIMILSNFGSNKIRNLYFYSNR